MEVVKIPKFLTLTGGIYAGRQSRRGMSGHRLRIDHP
jgi:hypothetical protein